MPDAASIADREIEAALDRGDIEGAAMLAAKLPHPAAYLRAMRMVNHYMRTYPTKEPPMPDYLPEFELKEAKARFTSLNTSPELHGDKPSPAADLIFTLNMGSSDALPMLEPELRGLLFCRRGAVSHDLADQTADIPDLRFPDLGYPLKWGLEFEATELRIHLGTGGKSDLVFPNAKISDFKITPKQGGTVVIAFRARVHPDEKQGGKLIQLIGQDNLGISLAPKIEDDDDLGSGGGASESRQAELQ